MKKVAFYIFLIGSLITFASCTRSAYMGAPAPYAPMRTQVIVVPRARHHWGYVQQGYRYGQFHRGYNRYQSAPQAQGNYGRRGW